MRFDSHHSSLIQQSLLITQSYQKWFKTSLLETRDLSDAQIAQQLFELPFPVLSAYAGDDPYLNYGNQKTLELWEMSLEQLLQTKGRQTAEVVEQKARQNFLKEVHKKGYIKNYEGIRISKTGKRFLIKDVCVWTILDEQGKNHGQAATFQKWEFL